MRSRAISVSGIAIPVSSTHRLNDRKARFLIATQLTHDTEPGASRWALDDCAPLSYRPATLAALDWERSSDFSSLSSSVNS